MVGDTLEEFVHHILDCTSDIFMPQGPRRTAASQIDNFVLVTANQSYLKDWGTHFIVECKNWNDKMDKPSVSDFAMKMEHTKCRVGLVFSRKGVTGHEFTDARAQIIKEGIRGKFILVIDEKDMEQLATGYNLFVLLQKKYSDRLASLA
ncbi:hypothetical protein SDC9_115549 [bioreactor metagenome]|uniref:Restriction endonuclease type IV Mrr domain-containing protein n=1 Tax=bioreactor metagenome TaxID=1076179 RepID=A0A645BTG0_9ZZZZ